MNKLSLTIRDYKTKFNLYRRLIKMGLEVKPELQDEAIPLLQAAENDPEALEKLKNLIKYG